MNRHYSLIISGLLFGLMSAPAAASDPDIQQLRQELELLKQSYEERINALEARLAQMTQERKVSATAVSPPVARDPGARALRQGQNAFNPGIAVILNGKYNDYGRDPNDYALPGFQLGGEAGLSSEGLTAEESEITINGNIDDRFYGSLTLGLHQDEDETEVELEEAYIEATGLAGGTGLKAGRFFSEIGYLNRQHTHTWDFADEPLAYRAFLGKQYTDDGVQARWLAPTDTFVEIGGELLRGTGFPASGADNEGKGAYSIFARTGGDVGTSHSWRVGLSGLWADARERGSSGDEHGHGGGGVEPSVFDGDSDLWIADFVWKWAPDGNPTERNFKFQTEYFDRREDGTVAVDDGAEISGYSGEQRGWYAQGVYQFRPRWRIGARYDRLSSTNRGNDPEVLAEAGLLSTHDPSRASAMLDYSRSEFSRLRFQYNQDKSRPGEADDQLSMQYIMSFGAHGGHQF